MKNSIKEVVFINNTVAPYRIPLFNQLKLELEKSNIELKVVFLCEKETVREWSVNYDLIKFDYEILPTILQTRAKFTTTSDLIINSGFLKYCMKEKLVLFGYTYTTFLILMIIRKLLQKETILFCESTIYDKRRKVGFKEWLKKAIITKFFSSYIVPGYESRKYIESYGVPSEKITIAENSVYSNNPNLSIRTKNNKIKILYVGRLAREKNVQFLLENIEESIVDNCEINIVGSGPEEEKLRSIKTKSHVIFHGFKEDEELTRFYEESDILVLPSKSEPWGLVVNEAINHGLAILVSDKVGCRHELINNNGYIFNLDDKQDFKSKLKLIYDNLEVLQHNSLNLSRRVTIKSQAEKISIATNYV